MGKTAKKFRRDPRFLRAMKRLCPTGKGGISSVTIEVQGQEPVVLTAETRRKIGEMLKRERASGLETRPTTATANGDADKA